MRIFIQSEGPKGAPRDLTMRGIMENHGGSFVEAHAEPADGPRAGLQLLEYDVPDDRIPAAQSDLGDYDVRWRLTRDTPTPAPSTSETHDAPLPPKIDLTGEAIH